MKRFCVLFLLYLSGCYTPFVYVNSITDPDVDIDKSGKFYLYESAENLEEKRIYRLVKDEMEKQGFEFVDNLEQSNKVILMFFTESGYESTVNIPISTSQNTSGNIGNKNVSITTKSTNYVPYNRYTKTYFLSISATNQMEKIPYWDAHGYTKQRDVNGDVKKVIKLVLEKYGMDFEGEIKINDN